MIDRILEPSFDELRDPGTIEVEEPQRPAAEIVAGVISVHGHRCKCLELLEVLIDLGQM